jgi:predicted transposase/invertase (TIGR01784 family)
MSYNAISESEKLHTHFKLIEREENFTLTEDLQIHYLELPKLPEDKEIEELEGVELWVAFFRETGKEGNEEKLEKLKERSEVMTKAMKSLETVSSDEKMLEAYRAREKARRDEISKLAYAEKQGRIKTAKKLFIMGLEISMIEKATELTKEELKEIEKEVKSEQS